LSEAGKRRRSQNKNIFNDTLKIDEKLETEPNILTFSSSEKSKIAETEEKQQRKFFARLLTIYFFMAQLLSQFLNRDIHEP
jgi:ADP-glucose pyrophosphorylase